MKQKDRLKKTINKEIKNGIFCKEIFAFLDGKADEIERILNILTELKLGVKISGERMFVPSLISEPPEKKGCAEKVIK